MARPTGVRTLAGYTLGDRLAQDIYGEVYRASEGKKQVSLLVVDPRLAGDEHFTEALSRGTTSLLEALHHRAVVGTVVVAHDGKSLVVVTEGVNGATSLADLLGRVRSRGGKVPPRVAATIARAVVDALSAAHLAGIAHGALHPRSVLIDGDGYTRITDFAVGYAAMTAASQGSEALPLKGLAGYLAPELALGDTPTPACDVFACGALVFTMLTGETPPGSLNTTPAVERLVQRALDTDLARRFGDAIELQENFVEALEDDRWESASPAEVARFVAEQVPADNLDAATEDLLASLGGSVEVTRQPGIGRGSGSVSSIPGSDPVTSDPLAQQLGGMAQAHAGRGRRGGAALDSILSELEDSSADGPLTVVDEPRGQVSRDPISELIALEAENQPTNIVDPDGHDSRGDLAEATPLPAPQPDEPGTFTRQGTDVRPVPRRVEPAPQPSRLVEKTRPKGGKPEATPAPTFEADAPEAQAAARPAAGGMKFVRPASEVAPAEVPSLGRSPVWTWVGLFVLLIGGVVLFVMLRQQGKELTAGEKAAAAERAKKDQEAQDLERRLRAEQADPGTIRVRSTPDGAAVWLLLGRTPFDSIALKTKSVWEMRVELDGHQSQDVRIGGTGWTGPTEDRKARIDVTLVPGENTPPLPALPAAPPAEDQVGLSDGSGTLHAESKPAGAAVWLLVGQTNSMELSGIEAGQAFELRALLDGYLPGYVRITAEEWRQGGDPRLPLSAAPKREVIERSVELSPSPAKKPR